MAERSGESGVTPIPCGRSAFGTPPCCATSRLAGGGDSDNGWQGTLDIEKDTARTIIDALAVAIDGKPSSAKNFNQFPYEYPPSAISKERREWEKIWTAPGSLDRWVEHMRFAGLSVCLTDLAFIPSWLMRITERD